MGFVLDIADLGRMDAPLLDALLVAAIIEANVGRLNRHPSLQAAYAQLDKAPPDDLRRPVSVNALANSLRTPFETVRRHINQLIERDVVASGPGGVYVPTSVLVSPRFVTAAIDRYQRVRLFCEDLVAASAMEPLPVEPPPVGHPQAPIRAVGRILGDYFFRTMDALHQQALDPLTGLVLLEVIRASTEKIPPAQAAEGMRLGWFSGAERTPVCVAQLSRRLGVPYETTRRRVGWLVEQGHCRRDRGGVVQAPAYLERPSALAAMSDNLVNVRRMHRQIAALLVGEGEAPAGEPAGF